MFCAISGEAPSTPVISKKSGLIYEQRLIEKYIAENGKDPVTGDELSQDDLLLVKQNSKIARPRPPTLTSVPALLTSLQNEYDAVMVEMFALRKAYDEIREELAHALYANDGATRVVARLLQERDEARSALTSIRESRGHSNAGGLQNGGQDADMVDAHTDTAAAGSSSTATSTAASIPATALARIDEAQKALSSTRKSKLKRKPAGYSSVADAPRFASAASPLTSMHGTRPAGVTALDVSINGTLIATGGRDKQVHVYDRTADKTIATLKGHTKEITHVVFAQSLIGVEHGPELATTQWPSHVASSSLDASIRIWSRSDGDGAYKLAHTISDLETSVVGLASHPTGQYVVAASEDGALAAYDVSSAERIVHVQTSHRFASLDVHPDGALIAMGTATGTIVIYDIHTGTEVASFTSDAGATSVVGSVHFSENGYLLASATSSHVEVWDLRKLTKTGTIAVQRDEKTVVRFDPSAQLLAVVGGGVHVYANKTWERLWSASEQTHSSAVTDAKWTWTEGRLLTCGMDRSVRTFAAVSTA